LAHLSKGGEVGEVKELFFTEKQRPNFALEMTELGVGASGQL
jgi:hypothetical protein